MFLLLLFVCLLMFSDTSACNTGADLSPLAAAPTASGAERRSPLLALPVSELLLKYLAPAPVRRLVPPLLCPLREHLFGLAALLVGRYGDQI